MGATLFMVKVVFEYFVQYFRKGEDEPYSSYGEKYRCIKAFNENTPYKEILEKCQEEIQSGFEISSKDTDEETGDEIECEITYDLTGLVSYEILATEDCGAIL